MCIRDSPLALVAPLPVFYVTYVIYVTYVAYVRALPPFGSHNFGAGAGFSRESRPAQALAANPPAAGFSRAPARRASLFS